MKDEFPSLVDRAYKEYRKLHFVEEIMSNNPVTIGPEASMAEASKIMGDKHIGSLIVVVQGKPEAIVTERDLLSKILARGRDPKTVKVNEVMSSPLVTISLTSTIKEAARMMIEKKGRLVVFREGKLTGIVTAADLIRSMPDTPETIIVDDIMTKQVVISEAEATVGEIAKTMGKERIGSVIIVKNKKPFGIFTERDLLTTFLAKGKPLDIKVGNVASSPLITIPSGKSVHEAAYIMSSKHVRRLPVTKNGKVIGVVTARDLVEAYAK